MLVNYPITFHPERSKLFSPIPYFKCGARLKICRCVRLASGGYGYKADSVSFVLQAETKVRWAGRPNPLTLDRRQPSIRLNDRSKPEYDTEKFNDFGDFSDFLDFVGDWR